MRDDYLSGLRRGWLAENRSIHVSVSTRDFTYPNNDDYDLHRAPPEEHCIHAARYTLQLPRYYQNSPEHGLHNVHATRCSLCEHLRMNLRKRTYIFRMDLIKGGNIMKNPYTQNDFDLGDIDIESAPILTDISIGICS